MFFSRCATKSLNDTPFANAFTSNILSILALRMVNVVTLFRKRLSLLATLVLDIPLTLPRFRRVLVAGLIPDTQVLRGREGKAEFSLWLDPRRFARIC